MDIIIERGAGLDVHKETVVACIMGTGIKKEIRTFRTMTNDLYAAQGMAQGNQDYPCRHGEHRSLLEAHIQHTGRQPSR